MEYEILDCTLRDGGYYTNWDFDDELVNRYFEGVGRLPIRAVEAGYCNHSIPDYFGEWFYLGLQRLASIRKHLRPDQQLGIMIDAKNCSVERVDELVGHLVDVVDIVRMAVAPNQFAHGVSLAKQLKKLGFRVGFNAMYLSTFDDIATALSPLKGATEVIDVLSLVDSYGGCTPTSVKVHVANAQEIFPDTVLGFHGHDNTCLSYANSLAALEAGARWIDATFVGMGRGAGNTRTEMMLVHKYSQGESVDFDAAAAVVSRFEAMQRTYGWGTNLPYMLSGATNLPQKGVMDWLSKNRYSPIAVVRGLQKRSVASVDHRHFPYLRPNHPLANDGSILIVGGGGSVRRHWHAIRDFVNKKNICVAHANTRHLDLIAHFGARQLVCLPGHAALRLPPNLPVENVVGFVVPEPPRFAGTVPADLPKPVFQAKPYPAPGSETLGPVSDIGPLALALGITRALSVDTIYLVGFDGYENASRAEQELASEIQYALNSIRAETVNIVSLTPTLYDVPKRSIYAEIVR